MQYILLILHNKTHCHLKIEMRYDNIGTRNDTKERYNGIILHRNGKQQIYCRKIAKALEMDIVSINKKSKQMIFSNKQQRRVDIFTADLRLENTENCFGLDRKDKIQRMQKGIFCDELRR